MVKLTRHFSVFQITTCNEDVQSSPSDCQRLQHGIVPKDLKLDVSIHVTVNTSPPSSASASAYLPSPGTLADLKRQRSDFRSRNNSLSSQDIALMNNQQSTMSTYSYSKASPAEASLQKFTSDPSEVVGGNTKTGCCVIM